jgi:hypothetical protein
MNAPHRYNVGDKVIITPECLEQMRWHSRQSAHWGVPSDAFLAKVAQVVNVPGEVTHAFPPGYEVTAKFDGRSFHMKDNWLAPYAEPKEA